MSNNQKDPIATALTKQLTAALYYNDMPLTSIKALDDGTVRCWFGNRFIRIRVEEDAD